ncbi:SOS response-associated peptidase [Halomonas sp. Bachu 37]|uniref:SOS response-associated peptidase n=1 Tax=Halomonas kashgarensis TaxID=3084920 RepID=UPI0032169B07
MCSHYEAPSMDALRAAYDVAPSEPVTHDLWPGYTGPFIRQAQDADPDDEDAPHLDALVGRFGLLPPWAKDEKLARKTYNARSETASIKPSFRGAWREARHCIIPALSIYEPDWRSGRAVPTRITRRDGELLSIAGLWERWRSPAGDTVHSYSMLTVNADDHPLMQHFHRPGAERRMVVILPQAQVEEWLSATDAQSAEFLRQYPAERLAAEPRPGR